MDGPFSIEKRITTGTDRYRQTDRHTARQLGNVFDLLWLKHICANPEQEFGETDYLRPIII